MTNPPDSPANPIGPPNQNWPQFLPGQNQWCMLETPTGPHLEWNLKISPTKKTRPNMQLPCASKKRTLSDHPSAVLCPRTLGYASSLTALYNLGYLFSTAPVWVCCDCNRHSKITLKMLSFLRIGSNRNHLGFMVTTVLFNILSYGYLGSYSNPFFFSLFWCCRDSIIFSCFSSCCHLCLMLLW